MLNLIDFNLPPEELFLDPVAHPGLAFLAAPDFLWRPRDKAEIHGFSASEHAEITQKIDSFTSVTARAKAFDKAIEFNTVPVLLTDAWFKKSYASASDRLMLSGAAGTRLLNRYCWENEEAAENPEARLLDYFAACQSREIATLPLLSDPLPPDTPFAIECRNTFNYYHFITESLCQLCLVQDYNLQGPIHFHFPNAEEKTRAFTRAFVDALFPELSDRVRFDRTPFHHPQVIAPYNFFNAYYQFPNALMPPVDAHAPEGGMQFRGKLATRNSQAVLAMNAVDTSLLKLRERGLRAVEGKDISHLPRRFWVGRESDQARTRRMAGEDDIVEMLKLFGFEYVAFERLQPLEQIAIMANAEMMISYHGAGFTNMLFANPEAWVVELGTLQTAQFRWGDFWRLANTAGCRYITFFADYNMPDPLKDPAFATDGIVPVSLSKAGLAQVMSFIVSVLGHTPTFTRPEDVARLGRQLMTVGAVDKALALYRAHMGLERGDIPLALAMADCFEKVEDYDSQLAALYSAYRADPTQWPTLISVIWCARKLNDVETMQAGLSILRETFPDRFAAFVKQRPWFLKHVA